MINRGPRSFFLRLKTVSLILSMILLAIVSISLYAQGISGSSSADQGQLPFNPISGRIIFEEKGCLECHAIDGYGGRVGPDLGREKFFGSFYDLASRLWNHAPQMAIQSDFLEKEWPSLTTNELDQLVSYIFYLRYLGEPGNVSMGKRLIETKGCLNCHSIGDQGSSDGIALDQLKEYASPLYIAQVIWNHGPAMQEQMVTMGVEHPTFDDNDITHLSAYLRESSRGQPSGRQYMSPGNPQAGALLFTSVGCSYCHAIDAGKPSQGARLSEMNLHRSVTAIAGTMWNHGNIMGEAMEAEGIKWPTFEGSEMADLIAYLYFSDYQISPGDPELGQQVFKGKSCAACHGQRETHEFTWATFPGQPTDLITTMWNHVPYMRELTVTKNIPWPELTAEDFQNLHAYLIHWVSKN